MHARSAHEQQHTQRRKENDDENNSHGSKVLISIYHNMVEKKGRRKREAV